MLFLPVGHPLPAGFERGEHPIVYREVDLLSQHYSLLRRTMIQPDGVTDDLGRKPITVIAGHLARHPHTGPPVGSS